ncbi:MAG: hypothetical protein EBZ56_08770 [Burkholderiaceae bacterium]|nr:hypothetical protein [Burkholderiaceae bacterium]
MWLDTHCHLDAPEFLSDIESIVERAKHAGVAGILLPAVRAQDFEAVQEITHRFKYEIPYLVYTLGIHPLYTDRAQINRFKDFNRIDTCAIGFCQMRGLENGFTHSAKPQLV